MANKHTLDNVLMSLTKKHDIQFQGDLIKVLKPEIEDEKGNIVENPKYKGDVGNGSWGKIDYLCKHHGYGYILVAEFK